MKGVVVRPLEFDDAWVGPYRLLAELGAGGMGRVYLASGPDGGLVAVKQIDPRYAGDEGFRERFSREVDACRRLSGAYTASVIDADPAAPEPWLASVYVPGPSLADVLAEVRALPEAATVHLAARLASALGDTHRAGLVHRDVKPSNVLLTDDGLRLIDFGIVRSVAAETDSTLTKVPIGSPAYMSPEQAQGLAVTTASDIFSLGTVLVVACTGEHPFQVPGDMAATLRRLLEERPDLSLVPSRLRRILDRCLAKDPAERPTAEQLRALIGHVPPTNRPWPAAVSDLIVRRRAEIDRLLSGGATEETQILTPTPALRQQTRPHPGPSFEPATPPVAAGRPPSSPKRPARGPLRLLVAGGAGVLLVAAFVTGFFWLWPDGSADTGSDNAAVGDSDDSSPEKGEASGEDASGPARGEGENTPEQEMPDEPVQEEPAGPPVGVIVGSGGGCMDVAQGSVESGTAIQLWECNGTAAQQWTLEADGSIQAFGKCLDVRAGDTENGTKVHLWDCHGGANQQWIAQDGVLIDSNSGRCLDDPLDSPNGTQLQIWDCHGGANQQWILPS